MVTKDVIILKINKILLLMRFLGDDVSRWSLRAVNTQIMISEG